MAIINGQRITIPESQEAAYKRWRDTLPGYSWHGVSQDKMHRLGNDVDRPDDFIEEE